MAHHLPTHILTSPLTSTLNPAALSLPPYLSLLSSLILHGGGFQLSQQRANQQMLIQELFEFDSVTSITVEIIGFVAS